MDLRRPKLNGFIWSLLALCAFAIALSVFRITYTETNRYWFLMWNLMLAWLPLLFAWLLYLRTPKGLIWSWQNFTLFILWLVFLPNAFYLVSDFIHVHNSGEIRIIYDIILFSAYAWCGFILGFSSLYFVHIRGLKRFGRKAHLLVAGSLLLSGFAIYLGRYLRWNSWDIIFNPIGLIFDVTDRLINPTGHVLTFGATILFFVFLSLIYVVLWSAIKIIKNPSSSK